MTIELVRIFSNPQFIIGELSEGVNNYRRFGVFGGSFSEEDLSGWKRLAAGFAELRLCEEPCVKHGIVWLEGHSQPVIAWGRKE